MEKEKSLTAEEKRIVKALLNNGKTNQDVHAIINYERGTTVNFGRISGVKKDQNIIPATAEEVEFFLKKKRSFDPVTGLNLYENERLIRAREAMILAVTIFNSATFKFKTEVFSVLSNIAWTYLMHEHYERKGISILNSDNSTFALSHMLSRPDCPLTKGIKNNLQSMKAIRDEVEHKLLGRSDTKWLSLFQACCLNFDRTIVTWFGPKVSLQNELSIALQFGKLDLEHAANIDPYDIPAHIEALDALLKKDLSKEEIDDVEYQFKVVYTFTSASKGKSHIQFLSPDSEEGKMVHNVLQKYKIADEMYPYKPKDIVRIVSEATGTQFNMNHHTQAWQKHKVRPAQGSKSPEKTNRDFCIYHSAHRDYTYNENWIARLIEEAGEKAASLDVPQNLPAQAAIDEDGLAFL
ncbi:DUF3644 domain-containing protein [Mycobacterium sp. KBS0706]|uniref:DUF3644 domain-containing protein n=1 Tax=Mycobacterium sp. KBS0706 TaxID=2578109 RepID=UPI00163DB6B9|nr:DUF3644 domain-containing protein [Mycobacterium sp. KBS0706]